MQWAAGAIGSKLSPSEQAQSSSRGLASFKQMEIFESRYFAVNRRLLSAIGLWPYDDEPRKRAKRICAALALIAMGLPHVIGIFVNIDQDGRVLLENIGTIMLVNLAFIKVISSIVYESKLAHLYNSIARNWLSIVDAREQQILEDYSENGRLITLGWLAYLATAYVAFVAVPMGPIILDIVVPLNASRPNLYIMNGEFIVDRESNYWKIYLYDMLATLATTFIIGACDSLYVACVEHCLGLFAIVRYRLQMPNQLIYSSGLDGKRQDPTYNWMLHVIRLHSQILQFTVTLESTYEQAFFAIIAGNLVYCSLLCVLTLLHGDNMLNFVRFAFLCAGAAIHLFYLSWPGQKLIDSSSELHEQAYLNQWYESSPPTKKLLNFFMLRCSKPSFLTAGRFYVMNYDNFVSVIKKSISFMAVFSSFQ